LIEIDELAMLMLEPDLNFDKLNEIRNTNRKFRLMNSPLVEDWDNQYIIQN